MAYKRFNELNADKKSMILETALDNFAENNFKVASINKISKEANLSAGALYYYFEDKRDLFDTLLDYMSEEFLLDFESLDALFERFGYWEGIKEIVLKRLKLGVKNPKYMRLLQRIIFSEDTQEKEAREKLLVSFEAIFNYGYSHGFLRQDMPKDFLYSMHLNMTLTVNQWTIQRFLENQENQLTMDQLEAISVKAVDMISKAMSKSEEKKGVY